MYREKVIDNLLIIRTWNEVGKAYAHDEMDKKEKAKTVEWIDDALKLLKEQEPILLENQHKPYGISTNANSPRISRCPRCSKKVEGKQTRFCKYCGQAVKWNE